MFELADHFQSPNTVRLPLQQAHARTLRHLAWLYGLGVLALLVLYAPPWPGERGWTMLALAAAWALLWIITYQLAEHRPSAALALLAVLLPALAAAAAALLAMPSLALLSLLAPLLEASMGGALPGLLAAAWVTLLYGLLARSGLLLALEIPGTVRTQLHSVMGKLNCTNRTQRVMVALLAGLIDVDAVVGHWRYHAPEMFEEAAI